MEENDELKDSLKNMIKSNDDESRNLAIGIVKDNLEEFQGVWYDINKLITPQTTRYVEMYCKEDNHDKVYIVVENKLAVNKFETKCFFGRRGKTLREHLEAISYWEGQNIDRIVGEKKFKKGYKVINDVKR